MCKCKEIAICDIKKIYIFAHYKQLASPVHEKYPCICMLLKDFSIQLYIVYNTNCHKIYIVFSP